MKMKPHEATEEHIRNAGWVIATYPGAWGGFVQKWYHPETDDGSRYRVDSPYTFRYIVEDHPEQFKEFEV